MDELISVVVPVYNVEKYLAACVSSICNQTYNNIEIILVDDGSTDSSGEICDSMANKDKRVKTFHKNNGGLSDARNYGVEVSRGQWIVFVDSDDIISIDFVENMYAAYKQYKSDIICCEVTCFNDRDFDIIQKKFSEIDNNCECKKYDISDIIIKSFYQHISITGAPQKMYRRNLFEHVLFPYGRYFEDLATTYMFFEHADSVTVINKKMYGYRLRDDSIMNQSFNSRKMDCIWVSREITDYYRNTKVELAARCAAFRVNRLVYNQIPFSYRQEKKAVWNEIKKYRSGILCDGSAQMYERIIAGLSYAGMIGFHMCIWGFSVFRKCFYRIKLRGCN